MSQFVTPRRRFLRTAGGGLLSALSSSPAAADMPVPVDVGRQLFVDDYLIAETSLSRVFHKPRIHDASPVLKPETPLEMNDGYCPLACPFQDGLFYDPKDRLYKFWYHAGWFDGTAYAYSEDGIRWMRPNLDVEPGTNRVLPNRKAFERDGAGIWLDQGTSNPDERFKLFVYHRQYAGTERRRARLMPANPLARAEPSIPRRTGFTGPIARRRARAATIPISTTTRSAKPGSIRSERAANAGA